VSSVFDLEKMATQHWSFVVIRVSAPSEQVTEAR